MRKTRNFRYFFVGEYFADAIRNTIAVLIPIIVFFALGNVPAAVGVGVSALLISMTDMPDNKLSKTRTAVYSIAIFFLTSLLMSFSLFNPVVSAIALIISAFILSLLASYGNRMSVIGTGALVLAIFIVGLRPANPLIFSLYILSGSIWYFVLSLGQAFISPYRSLHHAIFEGLITSSAYLRSKAKNYDLSIPYDENQREAIRLHVKVNQKHEIIRGLLLTDNKAMDPKNKSGQVLLGRAMLLIDLHEQLNAVNFDYSFIRSELADSGVLTSIFEHVHFLADQLEQLGFDSRSPKLKGRYQYHGLGREQGRVLPNVPNNLSDSQRDIVIRLLNNMDGITKLIEMIRSNELPQEKKLESDEPIAFDLFLTKDAPQNKRFSLTAPAIRFSFRLTCSFIFLYGVTWLLGPTAYSYWAFLTLVVVARPGFAITRKRNLHRVQGTFFGIIIGMVLYMIFPDKVWLLFLSAVFLVGFYAFNRINYALGAFFATLAVTVTLGVYHGNLDLIMWERMLNTILGCAVSVLAIYLFPIWDTSKLDNLLKESASYSAAYLQLAIDKQTGKRSDPTKAKMARKDAFMSLYTFFIAIENAVVEPSSKKINFAAVYALQIILYKLNAVSTAIYLHSNELLSDHMIVEKGERIIKHLLTPGEEQNTGSYLSEESGKDSRYVDGASSTRHQLDHIMALSEEFVFHYKRFKLEAG